LGFAAFNSQPRMHRERRPMALMWNRYAVGIAIRRRRKKPDILRCRASDSVNQDGQDFPSCD
jgi:hypothetical protein